MTEVCCVSSRPQTGVTDQSATKPGATDPIVHAFGSFVVTPWDSDADRLTEPSILNVLRTDLGY